MSLGLWCRHLACTVGVILQAGGLHHNRITQTTQQDVVVKVQEWRT